MRAVSAIAGFVAGLAAVTAASAADLDVQSGGEVGYGIGDPAPQVVIWDSEPGVVTRAYWLPPWRNRHYFPNSGQMPEIGRDEDLKPRSAPKPAKTYRRSWSASSVFQPEYPTGMPMVVNPEIYVRPHR